MATKGRQKDPGLIESDIERLLREEPCSFEFFQAVTLLQRLRPDRQPVGRFSNPEDEAVHFGAHNRLAFPASQIQGIEWPEDGPPRMTVNFMGLTGPMGVLPHTYTELILDRARSKDTTLQSFLDIFNHRMVSFFHRAWEKYRFPVTHALGEENIFTHHLLDFIGLGTEGLPNRQAVPDDALLHFTGFLSQQARSASALEEMLGDYFEVPVEVVEFVGTWYRLDSPIQCSFSDDESESEQLGMGAVVGDEMWDQQSRVRIKLGPMPLERYRDFLPDGAAYGPLKALTKFFANDQFDFEAQLILESDDVPKFGVGFDGDAPPRLGWVSWLKTAPLSRNPDETILDL